MCSFVSADLQCSQQVTGLSQSGPGSIQLLKQFVLRLLQRGDLPLRRPNVLLPLLHLLLQPSHLRAGETELHREAELHSQPRLSCTSGCISAWLQP